MRKLNPGYTKLVIKAGSYPKQTADVPTIGYATHVIARCDLDESVVYKVLKGMVDNKADLAAIAKAMGDDDAEDDGRGHRRADAQGRAEVLQGSRRALIACERRGACPAAARRQPTVRSRGSSHAAPAS